jgi:hypothetical protein
VDPQYIQTNDPNEPNFFKLQPYSPLIHADEDGNAMGSQGVLTGQEVWPADLGGGHGVDFKDFAILALNWRDSNTIPAVNDVLLDNFESYTATGGPGQVGTLLGPRVLGSPDAWRVVAWNNYPSLEPHTGWLHGSSTLSLLTDANDANSPTKAMKWVYDVNTGGDVNAVRFTEILVMLPAAVNLTLYNEIRVALKRDANNSPDYETYMYAKFIDLTECFSPPDKWGVVNSVIGGQTASPPGVYYDWTIDFDNLAGWQNNLSQVNMTRIGAIIFGIQTQPVGPYGRGKGTIYVDDIRLVDRPGCSGNPVGDLNKDCRVNFADVHEFALYWLMGK